MLYLCGRLLLSSILCAQSGFFVVSQGSAFLQMFSRYGNVGVNSVLFICLIENDLFFILLSRLCSALDFAVQHCYVIEISDAGLLSLSLAKVR